MRIGTIVRLAKLLDKKRRQRKRINKDIKKILNDFKGFKSVGKRRRKREELTPPSPNKK
jgi:hypothetical protein